MRRRNTLLAPPSPSASAATRPVTGRSYGSKTAADWSEASARSDHHREPWSRDLASRPVAVQPRICAEPVTRERERERERDLDWLSPSCVDELGPGLRLRNGLPIGAHAVRSEHRRE